MKTLFAKEIRLMLPVYGLALLLAVVPVRLLPDHFASTFNLFSLYPFCFGVVLLALASFGREFGLNTFPALLAQPLERATVWRAKIIVLGAALATVFGAWCWSSLGPIRFVLTGHVDPGYDSDLWRAPGMLILVRPEVLAIGGILMLAIFSGGLWTTLLLRQVTAPFWFTILLPATIAMVVDVFGGNHVVILAALALYSIVGFLFARRLFYRAEEIAWTGGILLIPGLKSTGVAAGSTIRVQRPWATMLRKEFQLQQIGLAGMGILFAVHLGTLAFHNASHDNKVADTVRLLSDLCCMLWCFAPLFVGATAVAEERKLGTMEAHLCLPMSSRAQFAIKLLFVVLLGGVLSAALLWIKVRIGHSMPGNADFIELQSTSDLTGFLKLAYLFGGIALAAFYASTLTRNLMQALVTGAVTAIVVWLLMGLANSYVGWFGYQFAQFWDRFLPWRGELVYFLGVPTLVAALVWLSYRNFRRLSETGRLWRRNLLGLAGTVLFIGTATAALYNRAWELLTPLEPRHGPSRIEAGNSPRLSSNLHGQVNLVSVLLPDGRVWGDVLAYPKNWGFNFFDERYSLGIGGEWRSLVKGSHFLEGSNWGNVAIWPRDVAALRSDGTLWASETPRPPIRGGASGTPFENIYGTLVTIGDDADWKCMVPINSSDDSLLLKTDGTLWLWEAWDFKWNMPWPGMRAFMPYRLGTESDWADIISATGPKGWTGATWLYAWKTNGQAWAFTGPFNSSRSGKRARNQLEAGDGLARREILDQTKWRSMTGWNVQWRPFQAGVREDGSLWVWENMPENQDRYNSRLNWRDSLLNGKLQQMGTETNWVAVTSDGSLGEVLIALKADGTLWRWEQKLSNYPQPLVSPATMLPVQIGTHDDWVAVCATWYGFISLAADGSLWNWVDPEVWGYAPDGSLPLLAWSRKPVKLGNIFGQ